MRHLPFIVAGPIVGAVVVNLDAISAGVFTLSPAGILIGLVCGFLLAGLVSMSNTPRSIHQQSVAPTARDRRPS